MAEREIWKPVPGFEGYEVSDLGRVRSVDRVVFYNHRGRGKLIPVRYRGRILKPNPINSGYLVLGLGSGGTQLVHVLVMLAFVGEVPEGQEVRHKNRCKTDCRLVNLHYGTRADNENDKVAHGVSNLGERNGQAKLTREQALEIRLSRLPRSIVARQYGIHPRTVHDIRVGKIWRWLDANDT